MAKQTGAMYSSIRVLYSIGISLRFMQIFRCYHVPDHEIRDKRKGHSFEILDIPLKGIIKKSLLQRSCREWSKTSIYQVLLS